MSFADLKKQSKFGFDKLSQEIEKLQNPTSAVDERFWKPEMDKTGNGYAIIRFLPAPDKQDLPWAKVWSHGFQGTGGWYIENSLTTLGKKDPVAELNRELWNSGLDTDKEIARKQKRKLSYYSNIYVVSDPANPSNEGRVFIFKYGKKIFDKIQASMQPEFQDESPVNPFDFWEGANFKLKIRKVEGYWNYDKSEFAAPSTLSDLSDSELEKIWRSEYPLVDFMDAKNFKSYEELNSRLNIVLGKGTPAPRVDRETLEDEEDIEIPVQATRKPVFNSVATTSQETPAVALPRMNVSTSKSSEDEEDMTSYFARLAEED